MDPLTPDDPCDDMSADIPARVVIIPDTHAENRRGEGDNLSTILHWHRRYDLGGGPRDRRVTEAEIETLRAGGLDALRAALDAAGEDVRILRPLGLLDHSGLHIWIGGGSHWSDAAGWDSGTVGVVYVTAAQIRETYMVKRITAAILARAEASVRAEIEEYDQYLRGEVYGFQVENFAGDVIDSCWGFYGSDYQTNGMLEHWSPDVVALVTQKGTVDR